jgi:hypothetical protein
MRNSLSMGAVAPEICWMATLYSRRFNRRSYEKNTKYYGKLFAYLVWCIKKISNFVLAEYIEELFA